MKGGAILASLRARGVAVSLKTDGVTLHVRAPEGALSPDDWEALRAVKWAIRALLRAEAGLLGPCRRCGQPAAFGDRGRAWCLSCVTLAVSHSEAANGH